MRRAGNNCYIERGTAHVKRCTLPMILLVCVIVPASALDRPANSYGESPVFYLFHSFNCRRCADAIVFLEELKVRYPEIEFSVLEVAKSRENQALFNDLALKLGIKTPGVPVFVFGESYLVGFKEGNRAKRQVMSMIEIELGRRQPVRAEIDLPLFGSVDPRSLSLPLFTVVIGLLDGINPCALWVLLLLLGLLVTAGSRKRMFLVGGIFVFFSALPYFVFMTAWLHFFTLLRFRDTATLVLGILVSMMGILNIKELFWFRKDPSLIIPEAARSGIHARMRKILSRPNALLLVSGTASLAFFVNLAEFGCTAGLPAIYTRLLSLQQVAPSTRYLLLVLYNLMYIAPLLGVLLVFTFTLYRYRLSPIAAKTLKVVSGVIMLFLGLLLVFHPELLMFA
jgi:hypothetical protein